MALASAAASGHDRLAAGIDAKLMFAARVSHDLDRPKVIANEVLEENGARARAQHPLRYPLLRCPACGSAQFEPVIENPTDEVNFLCRGCKRCWHVELG